VGFRQFHGCQEIENYYQESEPQPEFTRI